MPTTTRPFALESRRVDALPLVNHVLARLRFEELLAHAVPARPRRPRLAPAKGLGVLVRNLLLARVPLYSQAEWAARVVPPLLGLTPIEVSWLRDDQVGRALDRLFEADRATLLTQVVVQAVTAFGIDLAQLHNDSTTVTFTGEYRQARGRQLRGRRALAIRHGHNKDHRPDLKQLLFVLTVSADGAVPIHYAAYDGNTEDSTTHQATWEVLRALAGRPDFLYVGDSKLCTEATMRYIAAHGGRFLTVLPRTRREDAFFRDWLQTHFPAWQEVARRRHPRRQAGPPDVWKAVESPIPSAEGYRIVWIWSSLKAAEDEQARAARIEKAGLALEELRARLRGPRCRYQSRGAVIDAAAQLVAAAGADRWVACEVHEHAQPVFRQEHRGRPGRTTRYLRRQRLRFDVVWTALGTTIEYDARCDGIFPLITNDHDLPLAAVLTAYKYQPRLEKRHEQLKSVYAVAPVLLQNEGRIEALLFLYFVVLLVQALLEREVRRAMTARGIEALPLYPEDRQCRAPTAHGIFQVFEGLQYHELRRQNVLIQTFAPELNALQRQILDLLGISLQTFTDPMRR
jgi:transposase